MENEIVYGNVKATAPSAELQQLIDNAPRVWIYSDSHLLHDRIVQYSQRPGYDPINGNHDVELHNRTQLDNLKRLIGPDDLLFHLGDVSMNSRNGLGEARLNRLRSMLAEIPGHKIVTRGNHDSDEIMDVCRSLGWHIIEDGLVLDYPEAPGWRLLLHHYPIEIPGTDHLKRMKREKVVCVHGHCHNNPNEHTSELHRNVSAEVISYAPQLLSDIRQNLLFRVKRVR